MQDFLEYQKEEDFVESIDKKIVDPNFNFIHICYKYKILCVYKYIRFKF